ncbi:MAG: alpha-L-fucosidase [Clostridia bacterium]|nr:alpha-L-fucosidase [Clostridia bacterium]
MTNIEWFKQAKYGMMLHWGLYSLLGGEYKGQKVRDYAEWIQSYFQISIAEYEKLASAFNPIGFDAEEYVKFAKDCGMNYIVITTKHHDGFALYHSECDKFNVYDATPFHRDILGELSAACRKYGLKLGIYYSQDLDWHHPHGGGYNSNGVFYNSGTTWDNSWDFKGEKNFDICFNEKILPQIKEIMTNYGDICLAWFDVPMTISAEQSELIYKTVKDLQPDCLINSRLGNGKYDYVSLGDNEIPEKIEMKPDEEIDYQDIGGFKPSPYGLYESACTLNDTWGFSYYDKNWKSAEKLAQNKAHLNSLGINYLLNVGPDPLGRIPLEARNLLIKVREYE